jgi:pilus assembly protein Flp/PilA
MKTLKDTLIAFLKEEEGLTTVEYAVAGSLVAAVLVVSFTELGTAVGGAINTLCTNVGGADCDGQ